MQGSAFFDKVEGVDADDFAGGEKFSQDTAGAVVIACLAECRDKHAAIDDEKIDVGGGQYRESPSGNLAGFGHRHFDEFEWFS